MTVIMPKLKGSYNIIDIYLKHPHFDAHMNKDDVRNTRTKYQILEGRYDIIIV